MLQQIWLAFLFILPNNLMMGSELCKTQNLFKFDKNLAFL